MNDVIFDIDAFKEYMEWQTGDRKTLKKINDLIIDIQRNGLMKGMGKPDVLKHLKAYSTLYTTKTMLPRLKHAPVSGTTS